jgi:hypothetical protein
VCQRVLNQTAKNDESTHTFDKELDDTVLKVEHFLSPFAVKKGSRTHNNHNTSGERKSVDENTTIENNSGEISICLFCNP